MLLIQETSSKSQSELLFVILFFVLLTTKPIKNYSGIEHHTEGQHRHIITNGSFSQYRSDKNASHL